MLGLLLAETCAFAQSPPPREPEPIVVFADRALPLRADGTQAVTVIERAEIAKRAVSSLPQLLREVAGVHVDRLGAAGPSNVYVRGAEPNHTLVLVDGVRVNDPTDVRGGSADLAAIALHEIERIELLRGASSAQFGADAIGGVVNIVTRRGEPGVRLHASAGGHGYRDGSVRGGIAPGSLAFGAGASRLDEGERAQGGESRREFMNASVSHAGPGRELRLHAREARSRLLGFSESSGGVRLAANRELEARDGRDRLASFAWREAIGARWRLSITANVTDREEARETPAVFPGPGGAVPQALSQSDFRRTGLSAQLSAGALPLQGLAMVGVEGAREEGLRESILFLPDPLPTSFELQRDTRAAFVQLELNPFARLRLLLASRRDDIDPGGKRTSNSGGICLQVAEGHALRAHASEGFKPPSFFGLADPLVGNAALRPESSRARELGYDAVLGAAKLQLTAFDTRYRDLVDFDPETFRMVNRAGARVRGAEAQLAWRPIPSIGIEAAYTAAHARLDASDAHLRNRPRHRGSLAVLHERGRWSARLAAVHVGRSFDFSVPTGEVQVSSRATADLSLRWKGEGFAAGVALDNVTGRRYESFVGFPDVGRRARIFVELAP